MIERIVRASVGRRRVQAVERVARHYDNERSREDIEETQLARFNARWAACLENVPFYQSWAAQHSLPARIDNLQDLKQFPDLTKKHIQERQDEIFSDGRGGTIPEAYSTGGTTGTPTRFPRGTQDMGALYPNTFVGRTWWGLKPFDSYVHVWGHSHLFGGAGLAGQIGRAKRAVQDRLVGAVRVNAYDMTEKALAAHSGTIVRRNPRYLVGYTSAIFRICRHIEVNDVDISSLTNLRAVLVTAETVTKADVELIERVLNVPVMIEYGAAETGVLAFSRGGSWPLHVLWRSFIIMVDKTGTIRVTTLDDRLFPLINYVIGDLAQGGDIVAGNALTLAAVMGRTRDVVSVRSGDGQIMDLSPILPVHILKSVPGVTAVQYHQDRPGQLTILVSGTGSLDMASAKERFYIAMRRDYPGWDDTSVSLRQIDEPQLTKAGKQALFV